MSGLELPFCSISAIAMPIDNISFITPHGPLGLAQVTASPTIGAAPTMVCHSSAVKSDLLAMEMTSSSRLPMRRPYARSTGHLQGYRGRFCRAGVIEKTGLLLELPLANMGRPLYVMLSVRTKPVRFFQLLFEGGLSWRKISTDRFTMNAWDARGR